MEFDDFGLHWGVPGETILDICAQGSFLQFWFWFDGQHLLLGRRQWVGSWEGLKISKGFEVQIPAHFHVLQI